MPLTSIVQEALSKVKQKALEVYNNAVETAKETLISTVKAKIKETITAAISGASLLVPQTFFSTVATVKGTIAKAARVFSAAKSVAAIIKSKIIGAVDPEEQVIEAVKQAAEQYKNQKLNSAGITIGLGVVNKANVLGPVSPTFIEGPTFGADSSDPGLSLQLLGAKVKLNSIDELINVIDEINDRLSSYDAAATRDWVHRIEKMHPIVDEEINTLEYFKPISSEMGTTYLRHTPDTQTLALGDWSTDIPNSYRRTLEYKMDGSYERVNNSYHKLNKAMARNLSTEYYGESEETTLKDQNVNYLFKTIYNNDYHIAGDYTFAKEHVGLLESALMTALITYVGGAGKLINWLDPVISYNQAICSGVSIKVEGNDITVDLKGNKVGVIATVIDKKPITALECK